MRLLILCLLVFLAACGDRTAVDTAPSDTQVTEAADEIRTYEVAPERRNLAINILQRMAVKSVAAIDADTLAVLDSADKHAAMAELLAVINEGESNAAGSSARIGVLKLWQLDEIKEEATSAAVPDPLQGPIRAIRAQFGDVALQVSDSTAVSFSPERLAAETTSSRGLHVVLFDEGGNLGLQVRTRGNNGSSISTALPLQWNDFIVLSQATVADSPLNPADSYRTFLVVQLVSSDEQ